MNLVHEVLALAKKTDERVKRIENLIEQEKEVMTIDEAAAYTKLSKSYLYKLTHQRRIPFYKPLGKYIYFDRKELLEFLHSNRIKTRDEIEQEAQRINAGLINSGRA
jgi:excisionase family DNA binding protein